MHDLMTGSYTTSYSRRRWTRVLQGLWILVASISVGFYIISALAYYQTLLVDPFFKSTIMPVELDLSLVRFGLERFGITLNAYAITLVAEQSIIMFVCCLLGFLIFRRRPAENLSMLMSIIIILIGTLIPVQAYAMSIFHVDLGFLGVMTNLIGTFVNMLLIWIFPNGHFVPAWSKWTFFTLMIVGAVSTLFPNFPVAPIVIPLALVLIGSGLYAQYYRYRYVSNPVEKQQTKWVFLALIIAPLSWVVGGLLLPAVFPFLTGSSEVAALYNLIRTTINNFANLLIPLAIGLSILRYRLWDIDVIIRKTLVYSLVTGLLALVYFGSVLLLQELFSSFGAGQSPAALVLSTLAIAALFSPLRRRVQEAVDRRFYRKKYNGELALAAFAEKARDEVDVDLVSAALFHAIEETVQPKKVSVWLENIQN